MHKIITLLCLVSLVFISKAQIDPNLTSQLQNVLDNSVSNSGNNGVSAHLIMPDGQTWSGTAGYGAQNLAITDSTLFNGASTTKLNIATLMLMLVEENLVDLDESWSNYVSLNVEFDPTITVRQLLNHTSGIADYLETSASGSQITSDFDYFFTPQYILENIVSSSPDFPAGTGFQYSNSNYVLAALIIEEVTGNPVHVELRTRIWEPLSMTHTYFGGYENFDEPSAGIWWNFGAGLTDYSAVPTTSMLSFGYGAGNIVSCPTDLAILLSSLLNGDLVSAGSLEEMLDFVPASFSSWTAGYGLGIHHAYNQDGDTVIGHDGYYTNLTDMFHSMNYGFTLVTMTNTQTEWFGIFNPMYDILAAYFMTSNVSDFGAETDLSIFPNPASNEFTVSSSQIIDEILILDVFGKQIDAFEVKDYQRTLTVGTAGIYFVTIKSAEQAVTRRLIVGN